MTMADRDAKNALVKTKLNDTYLSYFQEICSIACTGVWSRWYGVRAYQGTSGRYGCMVRYGKVQYSSNVWGGTVGTVLQGYGTSRQCGTGWYGTVWRNGT